MGVISRTNEQSDGYSESGWPSETLRIGEMQGQLMLSFTADPKLRLIGGCGLTAAETISMRKTGWGHIAHVRNVGPGYTGTQAKRYLRLVKGILEVRLERSSMLFPGVAVFRNFENGEGRSGVIRIAGLAGSERPRA